MTDLNPIRRGVVTAAGGGAVLDEVLAYCDSPYAMASLRATLPLAPEPHAAVWHAYQRAATDGVWSELRSRLPQLLVPIRQGISKTVEYGQVIRKGEPFDEALFGGSATLERPAALQLEMHEHPAGLLPVLIAGSRGDFETLYRALACHSEPVPVNPSVNAQMISGLVNWDRVARYRAAWLEGPDGAEALWPAEMRRVATAAPDTFYDRVILLGRGNYSGIPAQELDPAIRPDAWVEFSTRIRVEHEFTHYATKRLYGIMRLNLLDEIIADCMGMAYALGAFRARPFLMGLGISDDGHVTAAGRAHTYRGTLGDEAFRAVCRIVTRAALRLEGLTGRFYRVETRGLFLLALADLPIDLLASESGDEVFAARFAQAPRAGLDSGPHTASEGVERA